MNPLDPIDSTTGGLILLLFIILILIFGMSIGVLIGRNNCMTNICVPTAIENNCGQFNSITGVFEWKTK